LNGQIEIEFKLLGLKEILSEAIDFRNSKNPKIAAALLG
jgi:hypothetical protein